MTSLVATLAWVARLSVVIFVVSSMLAMGMSQRLADVVAPLKDWRSTLTTLGVNFVIAPLLALILSRVVPLEPAHTTGLLLLGGTAGAPFLPKLAETAGGSVAHSVALMVLLMVATIVFVPLVMPLIVPGLQADALGIAGPLIVLMLIPLSLGFALAQLGAERIGRFLALVRKVSNLFFVVFLLALTVLQFRSMLQILGSFASAPTSSSSCRCSRLPTLRLPAARRAGRCSASPPPNATSRPLSSCPEPASAIRP